MHSATAANLKVFLASANEEEEATTQLASEMVFKMSPGSTTTMPLNANRNNVHNGIVQVPSTFNDTIKCNTTTSSTSVSLSNVSAHECEVESQLILKVSPTHPVPPNNAQQITTPTNDNLQLLSDNELNSTDATCSINTTAVGNDESVVSSSAVHVSESSCSNGPILNLIFTSGHAKETTEGTADFIFSYIYYLKVTNFHVQS